VLADALEHLVRGIVRHPDDVTVSAERLSKRQDSPVPLTAFARCQ
jgi:predicted RNA-binding protein YlqC (UPF0109 family)